MQRKIFSDICAKSSKLGPREIHVIASTETRDRVGDIMLASGCNLSNYARNPIVLAQHDPDHPIGTAKASVIGNRLQAIIEFAPEGASRKADEYCALAKSGVISACSIGYEPLETEPIRGGGFLVKAWELLELSLVSVPCNAEALIAQRSYRGGSSWPQRSYSRRAMTAAERAEEMAELGRKGAQQEGELLVALQGTPYLGPALRQMDVRDASRRSAAAYDNDPFIKRQMREREMQKLRSD